MLLSLLISVSFFQGARAGEQSEVITALVLGQSEAVYLFSSRGYFRNLEHPELPIPSNLTVFLPQGVGQQPVRREVNADTVAAGQINPSLSWLSAFLAHAAPGRKFVVGGSVQSGLPRSTLTNDSNTERLWRDLVAMVDRMEEEFGPVQHLIECWYGADRGHFTRGRFKPRYWPLYFGVHADGSPFTLGGESSGGVRVDHCFWDGTAPPDEKGRGIFARSQTSWHIIGAMPRVLEARGSEAENFSFGMFMEPARARVIAFEEDPFAKSVRLRTGPSAHIAYFPQHNATHPATNHPDGQIRFIYAYAMALLRGAGIPVHEPTLSEAVVTPDGSYADILVNLPNGGTLTTLRRLRNKEMPDTPSPHQQEVTGFEITRGPLRRPVFRRDQPDRPAAFRGTVRIIDSGSGSPRQGRVRVTAEEPFAFGDSLSYLRGPATAMLVRPRDVETRLYKDMLVEHVPSLFDESVRYPFEGIAIRPYQEELELDLPEPAFVPRGAYFDGESSFRGRMPGSVRMGGPMLMSFWIRTEEEAGWENNRTILELRTGGGQAVFQLFTSNRNLTLRYRSGGQRVSAGISPPGGFVSRQWHHVLVGIDEEGNLTAYLNEQEVANRSLGVPDDLSLGRMGLGSDSAGRAVFTGGLGHFWLSLGQSLDISEPANRAKFIRNGKPVNPGGNGDRPLGSTPPWYFDGEGVEWSNRGTAPNVPFSGTPLTPTLMTNTP